MNLSSNIYKIIEAKHMKQSSLAIAAGYTPKSFNDLLRSRRCFKADDVMPICNALGITPNELFNYE